MSADISIDDLHIHDPREARKSAVRVLKAGIVPFLQSSPGIGKSSIMRDIAKEFNLKVIDHRLSTSSPTDLSGLPWIVNGMAKFNPFEFFPIKGMDIPEGYDGWLLFLDEFNSAPKSVQAAAYQLVLDRQVGQHQLHSNVLIAAAGNLETDRAITNQLSTAMQSRVIHIRMETNLKIWLEDVGYKHNYDSRITGYLNFQPSSLMDFQPNHSNPSFSCPRTWEFMQRLIASNNGVIEDSDVKLFAGTITPGVATSFMNFVKVYAKMLTFRQIMHDPTGVDIPSDPATRWAVSSMLGERIATTDLTDEECLKVFKYVNRNPTEIRVMFFRSALTRKPTLRRKPEVITAIAELSRYLQD